MINLSAKSWTSLKNYFWIFIVIMAGAGLVRLLDNEIPSNVTGRTVRIIDGDSLIVGGVEVRLLGIDAPEGRQTCLRRGKPWACGKAAARQLRGVIANAVINCKGDSLDRFNRLLATCWKASLNINQWMVEQGWAVAYGRRYQKIAGLARRDARGIWSSKFERPGEWRRLNGDGSTGKDNGDGFMNLVRRLGRFLSGLF